MSREPTAIEAGMAMVQERLEAENEELRAEVERLKSKLNEEEAQHGVTEGMADYSSERMLAEQERRIKAEAEVERLREALHLQADQADAVLTRLCKISFDAGDPWQRSQRAKLDDALVWVRMQIRDINEALATAPKEEA